MENNTINIDSQLHFREVQRIRLRNIHRTQNWLAKQLGVNISYISLYFNNLAYSELSERIERRLQREERAVSVRKAKSSIQVND